MFLHLTFACASPQVFGARVLALPYHRRALQEHTGTYRDRHMHFCKQSWEVDVVIWLDAVVFVLVSVRSIMSSPDAAPSMVVGCSLKKIVN